VEIDQDQVPYTFVHISNNFLNPDTLRFVIVLEISRDKTVPDSEPVSISDFFEHSPSFAEFLGLEKGDLTPWFRVELSYLSNRFAGFSRVFRDTKIFSLNLSLVSHSHSAPNIKSPDEKDSHRMLANLFAGVILGCGRVVYGVFRFMFSVLSSLA